MLNIKTPDWIAADCDRVGFWLKGDGLGERLNLMFGNYEHKPALCFRYGVALDFTGGEFAVPFDDFRPKGQMQKHLWARLYLTSAALGAGRCDDR